MNFDNDPPAYRVTWGLIGAVVGGFVVAGVTTSHLQVFPEKVTYNDLAAILLTAVGVILTAFALAAGLAALWGYREFKNKMKEVAADVASDVSKAEITKLAETEFSERREEARLEIERQKALFQAETKAMLANAVPQFEEQVRVVAQRLLAPEAIAEIINRAVQEQLFSDPLDDELDFDDAVDKIIDEIPDASELPA